MPVAGDGATARLREVADATGATWRQVVRGERLHMGAVRLDVLHPPAPEWEHIVTGELVKRAEAAINGRQTVDEALTELDQRVDEILEKRRWILDLRRG